MNNDLEAGTVISHYRVLSKIGSGGMGAVYLAEDTKLGRRVALKILLPEVAGDDERVHRFVQEAKSASALNHPNILTVFEIGMADGLRYIATEFIQGDTLRQRLSQEPMKLGDALGVTLQATAALRAVYEAGIVHRDIKPENIMIRADGLVKVLDFGLAKLTAVPAASLNTTIPQFNTDPGTLVGTVAYMSPEQALGRDLDARSDIFSLGIVMFELFTGRRPFEGESHLDLISSILKDNAPGLRDVSPDMPKHLDRIVGKTLRKDRDTRYQNVKDLHIDIEDLREELKFEEKINRSSVQTTVAARAQVTNPSDLRSAFTTGLSKTRRFTLLHALLFVAAVTGIAGSAWYFGLLGSGASAVAPGSYKSTEVASWNSAAGELFSSARFSPDGKLIAFSSTKSGTKNIWVTQTNSTEAIQITNDAFANIDPIWSPKGDEIAYLSERGTGPDGKASYGVWRVSALGGTPPKAVGPVTSPSAALRRWTPTGRIYYQIGNELFKLDMANGVTEKTATMEGAGVRWLDISPDEKNLAGTFVNDNTWKIMIGDVAGTDRQEIASGTGKIDGGAWLPEKDKLFYSSDVEGILQVFVIDLSSRSSRQLTSAETDSSVVDASANANSVIFSSAKEESNLWRVSVADGREAPLARDLNAKLWPVISPDSSRVAFQSIRNLSQGNKLLTSTIAVKPVKGGDNEKAASVTENGCLAQWSPDGKLISFLRELPGGTFELWTANPDGGGERRLASGVGAGGYSLTPYNFLQAKGYSWSPDGGRLAYVSGAKANIATIGMTESEPAILTSNVEGDYSFYCPLWASDARRIAFSYQRKDPDSKKSPFGLMLYDSTSQKTENIYESDKNMRFVGWTADQTALIVAESEKRSSLPPEIILKRIALSKGPPTELARLKNAYFYNIVLSHDGKNIAYAAREATMDDLWVLPSDGGKARKLTANNDSGLYFSRLAWFPDGTAIAFGKQTRFSLLTMITDIN